MLNWRDYAPVYASFTLKFFMFFMLWLNGYMSPKTETTAGFSH